MSANVQPVTRWWQYVKQVAGTASQKEIAEAAGVSQPTVSRWAKGEIERATADVAVKFAVHYDSSVGEALVAAGVLDSRHLPVTITRHETPDDDTLIALLSERLHRDRKAGEGDARQPAPIAMPHGPDLVWSNAAGQPAIIVELKSAARSRPDGLYRALRNLRQHDAPRWFMLAGASAVVSAVDDARPIDPSALTDAWLGAVEGFANGDDSAIGKVRDLDPVDAVLDGPVSEGSYTLAASEDGTAVDEFESHVNDT